MLNFTNKQPSVNKPFDPCDGWVPEMAKADDGFNVCVTGFTNDERGYPVMSHHAQEKLVRRLVDKIRKSADKMMLGFFASVAKVADVDAAQGC